MTRNLPRVELFILLIAAKYPATDSTKVATVFLWNMLEITKCYCQTSKKTQMSREKSHTCELGDLPNKIRHLMQLLINPREFYNRNGQVNSKVHTNTSRPRIIKIFFRIKT